MLRRWSFLLGDGGSWDPGKTRGWLFDLICKRHALTRKHVRAPLIWLHCEDKPTSTFVPVKWNIAAIATSFFAQPRLPNSRVESFRIYFGSKLLTPTNWIKQTVGMTGDLWVSLTQENLSDAECSFTTGIHSHLALIAACGARSSKIGAWIKSWDAQDPWIADHVWYWDTTWTYPFFGQC